VQPSFKSAGPSSQDVWSQLVLSTLAGSPCGARATGCITRSSRQRSELQPIGSGEECWSPPLFLNQKTISTAHEINDLASAYNVCKSTSNSRSISAPSAIRKKYGLAKILSNWQSSTRLTKSLRAADSASMSMSRCLLAAASRLLHYRTFASRTKIIAARAPDVCSLSMCVRWQQARALDASALCSLKAATKGTAQLMDTIGVRTSFMAVKSCCGKGG
jgi:hypothetical protein